jgi:putative DNA primase/helicase
MGVAMMDLQSIARALGGEVCGQQVLCPGPGHSPQDRSLSVKLSTHAQCGFIVHSYSGDDWQECRDYVAAHFGLQSFQPSRRADFSHKRDNSDAGRTEFALKIWGEAIPVAGTHAQKYLTGRGIQCDEDFSHAIRFHPACPFGKERFQALVSLIRNMDSDKPQGIQRTALSAEGTAIKRNGKTLRMTLGPVAGGAIKIDEDADVTLGLCVGEGLETTLAGRQLGFAPAWSLLNDSGIANFPVLPGLEGLTIFLENDDANRRAARKCGRRWHQAGRDVFTLRPEIGSDLNDEIREAS